MQLSGLERKKAFVTDLARTARFDILVEGYVRLPHVAGTITLVRDEDRVIVHDPGIVSERDLIISALRDLGLRPDDVTDLVLSHHHPDHTLNAALFPVVPVHDFQWIVHGDHLTLREADGIDLTPSVRLLTTPGHSPEDITVLVGTADDVVALTHLWWTADGPVDDPFSPDREQLRQQREKVLELATLIVPGHGPPFRPSPSTPR
jgi:glyoxylase-like metal-dependent hydrolase (beta-lactamase superfamily II)